MHRPKPACVVTIEIVSGRETDGTGFLLLLFLLCGTILGNSETGRESMISTILLVFAFVLLCLAAKNIGAPNWALGWAGLACWVLSILLGGFNGGLTFHR